jgi:hypothetical protein
MNHSRMQEIAGLKVMISATRKIKLAAAAKEGAEKRKKIKLKLQQEKQNI